MCAGLLSSGSSRTHFDSNRTIRFTVGDKPRLLTGMAASLDLESSGSEPSLIKIFYFADHPFNIPKFEEWFQLQVQPVNEMLCPLATEYSNREVLVLEMAGAR